MEAMARRLFAAKSASAGVLVAGIKTLTCGANEPTPTHRFVPEVEFPHDWMLLLVMSATTWLSVPLTSPSPPPPPQPSRANIMIVRAGIDFKFGCMRSSFGWMKVMSATRRTGADGTHLGMRDWHLESMRICLKKQSSGREIETDHAELSSPHDHIELMLSAQGTKTTEGVAMNKTARVAMAAAPRAKWYSQPESPPSACWLLT